MNNLLIYRNVATGAVITKDSLINGLPKAAVEIALQGDFMRRLQLQINEQDTQTFLEISKTEEGRKSTYYRTKIAQYLRIPFSPAWDRDKFLNEVRENLDTSIYRDGMFERARNNAFAMQFETQKHVPQTQETPDDHQTTAAAQPVPAVPVQAAAAPAEEEDRADRPAPRRRRVTIVD